MIVASPEQAWQLLPHGRAAILNLIYFSRGQTGATAAGGKVILLTLVLVAAITLASYAAYMIVKWHYENQEAQSRLASPPSGTNATCPVCLEVGPMVALVPCGHTLCRNCAQQIIGRPCPSCRRQTRGSTEGLFVP
mmetsp:Transcript_43245/g.122271  ORF Transcript_43245/g.122271 Transcript_43245/m.122271 type:complete len:136 (+) Transcript_43245:89-496(+)